MLPMYWTCYAVQWQEEGWLLSGLADLRDWRRYCCWPSSPPCPKLLGGGDTWLNCTWRCCCCWPSTPPHTRLLRGLKIQSHCRCGWPKEDIKQQPTSRNLSATATWVAVPSCSFSEIFFSYRWSVLIGWSRKWLFLLPHDSYVAVRTKIRIITRGCNYIDHPYLYCCQCSE